MGNKNLDTPKNEDEFVDNKKFHDRKSVRWTSSQTELFKEIQNEGDVNQEVESENNNANANKGDKKKSKKKPKSKSERQSNKNTEKKDIRGIQWSSPEKIEEK
eukprot:TRINITY_DN10922_c0_g1_i1.p1 TRINITY_DN10922_c0_g1~~TRINITY_DN10922_c0_g1_i1.p1  ORF type:complete len:111 (+),score=38.32 TRINITY_DN10922_c0_g1_i1:26-334(+)